ncbi:hypothetical protein, partial [Streptomyces europaeiscabiei]|uniref:hypothetical protein n=1 Tax=Streptomyces europaeiscabiei TaxID=146819 RepID=UPI001968DF77
MRFGWGTGEGYRTVTGGRAVKRPGRAAGCYLPCRLGSGPLGPCGGVARLVAQDDTLMAAYTRADGRA